MKTSSPLLAEESLRQSLGRACLHDLPWLDQAHRNEESKFARFEKRVGPDALQTLRRAERLDMSPRGCRPSVWWADRRRERDGSMWRPHGLDEVFVEAFFPWWSKSESAPLYVTVVSSGPYGGLETLYINGRPVYQISPDMPDAVRQKWKADVFNRRPHALSFDDASRIYGDLGAVSTGNSRCILRMTKS
ncbi:MAG: hypothetical protein AB7S53_02435 [Thiomonas sp.]